jgi:hypothetical protein
MGTYRAVIACFLAVNLMSCATTPELQSGGVAQADDAAFPPNYRELIVQTIWARTDARTIRSARISQPRVLWLGLVAGGNRRAICVEVIRETPITSNARDVWAFTFKDGRVATAGYSNANCEGYAPFNDLLKQKTT